MLQIRYIEPNIIEVVEHVLSFPKTKTTYWYYDLTNNTKSMLGKKNEKPNLVMDEGSREWVEKYYVPRAKKTDCVHFTD